MWKTVGYREHPKWNSHTLSEMQKRWWAETAFFRGVLSCSMHLRLTELFFEKRMSKAQCNRAFGCITFELTHLPFPKWNNSHNPLMCCRTGIPFNLLKDIDGFIWLGLTKQTRDKLIRHKIGNKKIHNDSDAPRISPDLHLFILISAYIYKRYWLI